MAGPRDYLMATPRGGENPTGFRRRVFRFLRFGLVVIMLCVTSIIFLWPDLSKPSLPQKTETQQTPNNELTNPEFSSIDNGNHPYTLKAEQAIQQKENADLVDLSSPSGIITLKQDQILTASAKSGLLDQNTKTLVLKGLVTLSENNDTHLVTEQINIDFRAQTATSNTPVTLTFPNGLIKSSGLDVTYETGILVFNGPAQLTLNKPILSRKMMP